MSDQILKIGVVNQAEPNSRPMFERFLSDFEIDGDVFTIRPLEVFNAASRGPIPSCDLYIVESLDGNAAANTVKALKEHYPDAKIMVLHHEYLEKRPLSKTRIKTLSRFFGARGADSFVPWREPLSDIRDEVSALIGVSTPIHVAPFMGHKPIIMSGDLHFIPEIQKVFFVDPNNRSAKPAFEFKDFSQDANAINRNAEFSLSPKGQYYQQFESASLTEEEARLVEVLYDIAATHLTPAARILTKTYDGPYRPDVEHLDDIVRILQHKIGLLLAKGSGLDHEDIGWERHLTPLLHIHGSPEYGYALNVDIEEGFTLGSLMNEAYYAELGEQLYREWYPDFFHDDDNEPHRAIPVKLDANGLPYPSNDR